MTLYNGCPIKTFGHDNAEAFRNNKYLTPPSQNSNIPLLYYSRNKIIILMVIALVLTLIVARIPAIKFSPAKEKEMDKQSF